MLKLFLIFCPEIWLLDFIKIKELLRFDIINYQCGSNATEASRRLSEEFNIHAVQGRNIKSFVNKFELTGSVNDAPGSRRPITATSDEKEKQLFASLINSTQKSVGRLYRELEISRQSARN